uniref:Uncharacterized protein n=1 Tax=Tardiphaga robiniae TaxID=943830 RepID=A0A120MG46_9BRAD|nr:hypothetical protein PROKKA_00722 [Tardiphaga robiniae]
MRYAGAPIEESGGFHSGGDVGAAFLAQRSRRAPVVPALRKRQAMLELNDPRHFLPPRVIVSK